jgi:hypothetical protein
LFILLLNHWAAPLIDASAALRDAIARLGGIYRTHDALPAGLMGLGRSWASP